MMMQLRIQATSRKLVSTVTYISAAAVLTALTDARSNAQDKRTSTEATGTTFEQLLSRANAAPDSSAKQAIVEEYVRALNAYGNAVIEDSTLYFIYYGTARRVAVASDLNSWNPAADTLTRIPRTNLFFRREVLPLQARFEYKLVVDSAWILDPINRRQVLGGFGPNSEIRMPLYTPPSEIEYRGNIPHGTLDTLLIESKLLRRKHPVFVYMPPGYKKLALRRYPVLFVTDGGEYITLALMTNILDNMLAQRRIVPLIVVFVDPRTDVRDASTSKRMQDYAMSDTFVNSLVTEIRPRIKRRYRIENVPQQTGIMGASLGGLIATYAAFTRTDVFGLCAAQSPSYWWKQSAIISMVEKHERRNIKFYIDTGTIHDAQEHASRMYNVMKAKGYQVRYQEHPEGHNWVNWRARIDDILEYFWGTP